MIILKSILYFKGLIHVYRVLWSVIKCMQYICSVKGMLAIVKLNYHVPAGHADVSLAIESYADLAYRMRLI